MATNQNKLSPEEQALREKLNEADFHYQEADWKAIESEVSAGKWGKYKSLLKAAAAFVALSGAVYFINQEMQPQSEKAKVEETEKIEPNASEEKIQVQNKENSKAPSVKPEVEKSETITPATQTTDQTEEQIETIQSEINEESPSNELIERKEEVVEKEQVQDSDPNEINFNIDIKGRYCLGEEIKLFAKANGKTLSESKYSFRWFVNDKRLIQQESELIYSLDDAGEYNIKLKINDENSRLVSTLEESFKVDALPEIDFTYEDGDGIFTDFTAEFKPSPKNLDYKWFLDDEKVSLNEDNLYRFHSKGVYSMRMVYESESGCMLEVDKPVAIMEDFGPFANAFSPNGDGINAEFMPHGFENHKGYFKFTVVDLTGRVVFESNSPNNKWNGRMNNTGEALPEGQYIWKLNVADENGNKRAFTDRVKLLK